MKLRDLFSLLTESDLRHGMQNPAKYEDIELTFFEEVKVLTIFQFLLNKASPKVGYFNSSQTTLSDYIAFNSSPAKLQQQKH